MKRKSLRLIGAAMLIVSMLLLSLPLQAFAAQSGTFAVGKVYSGFKLDSEKQISEIASDVFQFTHVKSGARLIFLKNSDDNKVFTITFRTPPKDNTGVNHVIEHSVLAGSANYPTKSPIMDISRTSLATYANAGTYYDNTNYPVASRNEKDFFNIMGIYMDAVFYPNVLKNPGIFMQEGWHYETDAYTGLLNYNGIVYNEMKAHASSPSDVIQDCVRASILPDTPYRWNAGGDFMQITKLTREKLIQTYKENYQASNSYIYLYGDLDINKALAFLDKNYLSKFTKKSVNTGVTLQKPFGSEKSATYEYPLEKGADTRNKTYLTLNFVADQVSNKEADMALSYLKTLFNTPSSPIKTALAAKGIGNDVNVTYDDYMRQPVFSFVAQGTEESKKAEFEKTIRDTLTALVKQGLDQNYLQAISNSYEKDVRTLRSSTQRGIVYNNLIMMGWMYGSDPTLYLTANDVISKINASIPKRYFENFIDKYLLKNKHCSLAVIKPVAGLMETKGQTERENLNATKAKLSKKDLENIQSQVDNMKKWQNTPDSQAALSKIPTLSLSDINPKAEQIPLTLKNEKGVQVLFHPLYTNKLAYVNMYFNTNAVPQNRLQYINLLSNLLGAMDAGKYSSTQMMSRETSCMGYLRFMPQTVISYKTPGTYSPKLIATFSTLASQMPEALDTLSEVVNNTRFDNMPLLKQYIKNIRQAIESQLTETDPIGVELIKLRSYISDEGKYEEQGNLEYYKFMCDLDNNFAQKGSEIAKNLKEVSNLIFNKNGLTAGITADEKDYALFSKPFGTFSDSLNSASQQPQSYKFGDSVSNEGFGTASQVQYTVEGFDMTKLGYKYSGKLQVLGKILDSNYLMQEIRVKGGAYGAGSVFQDTGFAAFAAWRDPHLKETLDIFGKASDYLASFQADQKTMTNYIISTIGSVDAPMDPAAKGMTSDLNYLRGKTQQDIQRERDELLSTKLSDIQGFSKMVSDVMKQNCFMVIGSDQMINQNKGLFNKVQELLAK